MHPIMRDKRLSFTCFTFSNNILALVDSPNLPPYGQRSSERRKEQNRIAQRQLRERRLQQDAAQTAELERRQNEIERLSRMVEDLKSENIRLKTHCINRRRQSVIPISSLSRCLSGGTYGSTPNIFSQSTMPLDPSPAFQYERHSIDFGSLHRETEISNVGSLLSNPVNMGDSRSLEERLQCTADISDGDANPTSPDTPYCSVLPMNTSPSRQGERFTSSSRLKKRTHQVDNDDEGFDLEWPPPEKPNSTFDLPCDSHNASMVSSWFSVPPTADGFKVSTPILKPLVPRCSLDLSPKQSSPSSLEAALPISSFLPQSLLTSPRNQSCRAFDSYSPQSPSLSPVASHRNLIGDSTARSSSMQIRKSSTSGSSDISITNSVLSAPDLQSKLTSYNSHLMPFDAIRLSSQESLAIKPTGRWANHATRMDREIAQATQNSACIFEFGSSPPTQPGNSSAFEFSSPPVRRGSTLSSVALQMWGEA